MYEISLKCLLFPVPERSMKIDSRLIKKSDANNRLALYYQKFIKTHKTDYPALDYELPQIEQVLSSLTKHIHDRRSRILLDFIKHLAPYLEQRSLHNIMLKYVDISIKAAKSLGQNPGWLYLLGYRANWALGFWDKALEYSIHAIKFASPNSSNHAIALQALGNAQLNRGNYSDALRTFARASEIYHRMGNVKGEMSIRADVAAHYLNKADYHVAYKQYFAVMEFELHYMHQISDHTLLMMGVVSRRLKKFSEAFDYLYMLAKRAESNHSRSGFAVAVHHISWVLIDQGQFVQAREYAETARMIFADINDPRGASDVDEQLGLIAIAMKEYDHAQLFLERSLTTRKEIGNQQGYASSLHRMAKLNFMKTQIAPGINCLLQSLYIYLKIGMLPFGRVSGFLQDVLSQKIVS